MSKLHSKWDTVWSCLPVNILEVTFSRCVRNLRTATGWPLNKYRYVSMFTRLSPCIKFSTIVSCHSALWPKWFSWRKNVIFFCWASAWKYILNCLYLICLKTWHIIKMPIICLVILFYKCYIMRIVHYVNNEE